MSCLFIAWSSGREKSENQQCVLILQTAWELLWQPVEKTGATWAQQAHVLSNNLHLLCVPNEEWCWNLPLMDPCSSLLLSFLSNTQVFIQKCQDFFMQIKVSLQIKAKLIWNKRKIKLSQLFCTSLESKPCLWWMLCGIHTWWDLWEFSVWKDCRS